MVLAELVACRRKKKERTPFGEPCCRLTCRSEDLRGLCQDSMTDCTILALDVRGCARRFIRHWLYHYSNPISRAITKNSSRRQPPPSSSPKISHHANRNPRQHRQQRDGPPRHHLRQRETSLRAPPHRLQRMAPPPSSLPLGPIRAAPQAPIPGRRSHRHRPRPAQGTGADHQGCDRHLPR